MPAPVPILYLNPHGDRAGAERVVDALIRGHVHQNPQVFAPRLLCGSDGLFSQGVRDDGIPVDIRSMRLRNLFSSVSWLRAYLKKHNIRLIHTTMAHMHQFAWLASRGLNVKTMWFNHGPCSTKYFKGVAHAFPADAVVVMGEFTDRCHQGFSLGPKPRIIPYGLEPKWFESRPELRDSTRQTLGISAGERAVGTLGRIESWKRQHLFLDAIEALPAEIASKARFFVAGHPALGQGEDYYERLKQQHQRMKYRDRVRLIGYVESEPFLEALDIKVHCSLDEPFGMVVMEAMAKRKVVIGADSGGVPEMITHGVNGFLQDPTRTSELADRLADCITNYDSLGELRDQASQSVSVRFNCDRLTQDFENLYREMLHMPAVEASQTVLS